MRTLLAFLSLILLLSTVGCGEYIGLKATELPTEQATPEDMGGLPDLDNDAPSGNSNASQPEDLFNDDDPSQTLNPDGEERSSTPPQASDPKQTPAPGSPASATPSAPPQKPSPSVPQAPPSSAPQTTGLARKPAPPGGQTPPNPSPTSAPAPNTKPAPGPAPKVQSAPPPNSQTGRSFGWSVLEMAKWVIDHEARKVGPACNFFVQRVLSLLGFARGQWMANQFDIYAKQSFKAYKTRSFFYDTTGDQSERLKNYLWSMPEKTSFIFQWKQKAGHGHIAFVHRVQNNLVIYHASLNTALPRAQTTDVKTLLHKRRNPYTLNVFSDFTK